MPGGRAEAAELIRSEVARAMTAADDPRAAQERLAAMVAELDDEGRQALVEMLNATSEVLDQT